MASTLLRALLFVAFFVSGATGLVYEVIWSRFLALFVGSTSFAHTVVLATFMGGLALGNAVFGRVVDRGRMDPLRLYAFLELGLGLLCLLFPTLFRSLASFYLAVGEHTGPTSVVNPFLKVALSLLSMLGPCILMGGTLPVLTKYVVRSLAGLGGRISWLYFLNTAGAVLGCLLGGFYVVERAGLDWGMVATSLVNLAIGALFYAVTGKQAPGAVVSPPEDVQGAAPAPEAQSARQDRAAFVAVAVAGGLTMLYELCWIRILVLAMGGTVHSFTTMLTGFILGIAVGSALIGLVMRRQRDTLFLFALCELGIGLFVLVSLPAFERLPFAFFRIASHLAHTPESYPVFVAVQVAFAVTVMAVPTTLMGAALPLATRAYVHRFASLGRGVGSIFSVNTTGGMLGTAITGFLVLPRLGLEGTLLLGAGASGALGLFLLRESLRGGGDRFQKRVGYGMAALLLALLVVHLARYPGWDPRLMQFALYRWERGFAFPDWDSFKAARSGERLLYQRDDADASVAVTEREADRVLRVNGKPDASTGGDLPSQLMVGHIPMFLHPDPRRVMVVGLGSGATAGAVLRHEGATADVAEISAEVIRAAAFFERVNDRVLQNPRMSLSLVDAREYLLLKQDLYDVIVSEPTNVWVPGVAALFTQEFYAVVRSRLRPGGIFAQWLPLYSSEPRIVASAAESLHRSFPFVSVWMVADGDLVFVAAEERPRFDPEAFARRIARVEPARGLPPHAGVLAMGDPVLFLSAQIATGEGSRAYWGPKKAGPYHDYFPRLEFLAARAQFVGRPHVLWSELDERVDPRATEPLFLGEYLARFPAGAEARRSLRARYAQSTLHDRLARSLSLLEVLGGSSTAEQWANVPEASRGRVLLSRVLGAQIAAGQADADSCLAYAEAEGATIVDSASLFGRLPTDALVRGVDACAQAHPGIADRLHAGLVRRLAEAGAATEALARLDSLAEGPAWSRLTPQDRESLVDWGDRLNQRLGRAAEVERWRARRRTSEARPPATTRPS